MSRTVRHLVRVVVLAIAAGFIVTSAVAANAATVAPSAEFDMVAKINAERSARGLPRLATNLQMLRLARYWADRMAAEGNLRHRPDLADAVDGPFTRLAENVGVTTLTGADEATLTNRLHNAFMESSGHRLHILGDFNMVGVGVVRGDNGSMWVSVNFLKGPLDGFPLYPDLEGDSHERSVKRLFVRGLVDGCSLRRYCPAAPVTRRQMARALDAATATQTSSYRMASACQTSVTCTTEPITRAEMADMLAQSLGLAPVAGRRFIDVASGAAGNINAIVEAGIAVGCSASHFCPNETVSRAQMATFLDRALDL